MDDDERIDGQVEVVLPSGAIFTVLNQAEADYIGNMADDYATQYNYDNVADLTELDRLLSIELMCHRYLLWLGTQVDYEGAPFSEAGMMGRVKEASTEIRQIKKLLAIDKTSRDKARGEGSVAQRWEKLRERAQRYAVKRVFELDRALELTHELIGLVMLHDRSNDKERRKYHSTPEDILAYIREVYTPEFKEIDQHFRANDQQYWIREQ